MGQSTSLNSVIYTPSSSRRRSFLSPFSRRKKHKNPLSATFQAPCSSNFEALNINAATVEQVSLIYILILRNIYNTNKDRRNKNLLITERTNEKKTEVLVVVFYFIWKNSFCPS